MLWRAWPAKWRARCNLELGCLSLSLSLYGGVKHTRFTHDCRVTHDSTPLHKVEGQSHVELGNTSYIPAIEGWLLRGFVVNFCHGYFI